MTDSNKDKEIIAKLKEATGIDWHNNPYGRYEAFAHAYEADIIADAFNTIATNSGLVDSTKERKKLEMPEVSTGGVGARESDGVGVKKDLASNPIFLSAIAAPDFQLALKEKLQKERGRIEDKKHHAARRLEDTTKQPWGIREVEGNKDIYYIDIQGDEPYINALYTVLARHRNKVKPSDPIAEALGAATDSIGMPLMVIDDTNIIARKMPLVDGKPTGKAFLSIPNALIEHTDFIASLPDTLHFQIEHELKQNRFKEKGSPG